MNGLQRRMFRVANTVGVWLYRRSGGRVGGTVQGGMPVLLLTVRGRHSGQPRTTPVAYLERDPSWMVCGSAAGSPSEPQWFRNLRATDRASVERGRDRYDVDVRVLAGAERDEAFAQFVVDAPGFADYEKKSAGRKLPLALLTPVAG